MSKSAMKAPGMLKIQQEIMNELGQLQSLPVVSAADLAKHNTPADAWVQIDGVVYDVTKFAKLHPGGAGVLHRAAGKDATADFRMVHHVNVLKKPQYAKLRVGRIGVEELPQKELKKLMDEKITEKWIPFSEPYWCDPRGTLKSPYYKEKHFKWRDRVRAFMQQEVVPFAGQWDEMKKYPLDLHEKAYKAGIYAASWPEQYGGTPPEGGWDMFMALIKCYENAKIGVEGLFASWLFTMSIALPPILNHAPRK
jgi:cytochrome b involved in lipid metabolism